MPKALSARKRNAVLADIRAGAKSRNQIARDHGISASSVTVIARGAGIADAFDRSKTKDATRAREDDCRALRAALKLDLLGDAQRFRERAWSRYQVVVGTPEGAEIVNLDLPPLPDARAAYTAIGIAVDKSIRLEQHDSDEGGVSAVDEWLRGMLGER
jgi:hypothetical protein